MSDIAPIVLDIIYGHVEIVHTKKVENGWLWLGGYSITYDRDGKEVSRTENQWNCRVGYDEPEPRRTLWDRILDLWGGPLPRRKSMAEYGAQEAPSYEDRTPRMPLVDGEGT